MLGVFVFSNFVNQKSILKKPSHIEKNTEWFSDWFNSPYYHKLYNNRDYEEADFFVSNLISYLNLPTNATIWDLACGKGRYSIKLNKLGYSIVGTDLSRNSIKEANQFSNEKLDFFVHDMRTPFRINFFDAVFNLFTSIGYFDNEKDNFKVFESVYSSLKPNGVFVIDFFNAIRVKNCFVENTKIERDGTSFKITKSIKENRIIKRIEFEVNGKQEFYEEKVFLYQKGDFMNFAEKAGFKLKNCFGDYSMNPFNEENSERLILIFGK
jgi:SAM-dependent methyltransferase